MTPRESATDRLIIRAVEQRLATLDGLIDAMHTLLTASQATYDTLAQRCFLLEHRLDLLEHPDRRGRYDA